MALKVGCEGPQGRLGTRPRWQAAFRGSIAGADAPGFCFVDAVLVFVHAGIGIALALARLTTDLELVRTTGIRLFN